MERENLNNVINEINKIARLNKIQNTLENIAEEYDEFIEDFYFIEWLRISTNHITQKEELNNTIELIEELLEEIEISIFNAEDKLYNNCILLLMYNKKDISKLIENFEKYSDEYIIDIIMNFAYSNFYEIDEEYLLLRLEELLQGGTDDDRTGI